MKIDVKKVTRARKHQGRTANWLSSRMGVTWGTYSRYVREDEIPMIHATEISHALGIPIKDLTDDN